MKRLLLIGGILLLGIGAAALSLAALNLFAYHTMLDGSAGLFSAAHRRAAIFFAVGGLHVAGGAVCLFFRFKR